MDFLFGIQGRLNRGKYWLAAVIYILATAVVAAVGFGVGFNVPTAGSFAAIGVIGVVFYIVVLISAICVSVKRLHDRDKSGWWLLLFYLGPSILDGLAFMSDSSGAHLLISLASFAIAIWAFVELGCLRGTAGPNRFGPDPLAVSAVVPAH